MTTGGRDPAALIDDRLVGRELDGRSRRWRDGGQGLALTITLNATGPPPASELVAHGRGPGRADCAVAIVWPTSLGVDQYAATGRELEIPLLNCPGCGEVMVRWGSYRRVARDGAAWRLLIRRQRCSTCKSTHAVLLSFVTKWRLDTVEVIGAAIEEVLDEQRSRAEVARRIDVPPTTLSGWWQRFCERAELISVGFSRFCVAAGDIAPLLRGLEPESALGALRGAFRAARRRFGEHVGSLWRFANAVIGAELLTTNMDPSWSSS